MALKLNREPNLTAKHEGFRYQTAAVEAIQNLDYAAVFHEQGLGKTKIGVDLALIWLKLDIVDSVLVVTKRGLIQNWTEELQLHSHLVPRILSQDKRRNFYAFNSPARLYLTHYEVMKSESKRLELFLKTRRVGVILDEAHKIKNPESIVTQKLFDLSSGFVRRVIMTGTPIANRPYDLWAQIFFLDSGNALGSNFAKFKESLDLTNDLARNASMVRGFEDKLSRIYEKLKGFTVRETKDALEIQLPNKIFRNVSVEMEARQGEIYNIIKREFALYVVKGNEAKLDESDEILKRLLRLVQTASNPKLIDDSYQNMPAKFPILERMLYEITVRKEKAIVWTSFTKNVDWLKKELRKFGVVSVHGKISQEERNRAIAAFKNEAETRVLIATPASAKEGLTLTVANHAIFYDRNFSLDDYLQAQDRIHRISQVKTCYVTNLVASGTIDEWVDVLLSAKHLAARLAQGDITKDQYMQEADYAYGEMIKDILDAKDQNL